MNDTLSALLKIAKTPVQTVAYNHFEIARDAYRQGLFQECLDELERAICGDHTSAGYKLEWRFHQMKGTLHLGFVGADLSLVDLAKAEEAFLMAARYGKLDHAEEAGRAYLSAGWAAYCQGKMKEALAYTEQALALHPRMGEAFFQAAKVKMALGDVSSAFSVLEKAIDIDRFYALKAAGDGDFQKNEEHVRGFLDALRKEKYRQCVPKVRAALENIRFKLELSVDAKNNKAVKRVEAFFTEGDKWSLLDVLAMVQDLDILISELERLPTAVTLRGKEITLKREEKYDEEETYEEDVVIKPGGLFRKPITERRTKTRTVTGIRTVTDTFPGKEVLMEFCHIPAGSFMSNERHQVTLTKGFFLGKYPVTQTQWEIFMGTNPSCFKGADRPVETVSWDDCLKFIDALNSEEKEQIYRLPTEAEWEYACRGGSTSAYYFGDDVSQLGVYAWYDGNSNKETHAVGKKKPNSLGLFDMHGNVWEWCQDWDGKYSSGSGTDPQGPSSGSSRVLRGGSWRSNADHTRASFRNSNPPECRYDVFGFRIVRIR